MTISTLPDAPSRDDLPAAFRSKAEAFVAALAQFVTEVNATTLLYGVDAWVSGTTYAAGDPVWSPINLQTYRRIADGGGTTDPSADAANWALAYGSAVTQSPGDDSTAIATTAYADAAVAVAAAVASAFTDSSVGVNKLLNGDWLINQLAPGSAFTVNATGVKGPDGWSGYASGTGVFTMELATDPDNAALKCLKVACTTADATIGAGDLYYVYQAIEGQDCLDLMAGTANAEQVTIQFKATISVLGTYCISLRNSANNRSYVGEIVVASVSEAEYTVTLTLDTAGTWLYTNGIGITFGIALAAGTTYQTTAGAWAAGNYLASASQANFMSSNTNTAYIKRIRFYKGSVIRTYQMEDMQRQLARCQRHYWGLPYGAANSFAINGFNQTANNTINHLIHPVPMRAAPSVVAAGVATDYYIIQNGGTAVCSAVPSAVVAGNAEHSFIQGTCAGTLTVGQGSSLAAATAAGRLTFDARQS